MTKTNQYSARNFRDQPQYSPDDSLSGSIPDHPQEKKIRKWRNGVVILPKHSSGAKTKRAQRQGIPSRRKSGGNMPESNRLHGSPFKDEPSQEPSGHRHTRIIRSVSSRLPPPAPKKAPEQRQEPSRQQRQLPSTGGTAPVQLQQQPKEPAPNDTLGFSKVGEPDQNMGGHPDTLIQRGESPLAKPRQSTACSRALVKSLKELLHAIDFDTMDENQLDMLRARACGLIDLCAQGALAGFEVDLEALISVVYIRDRKLQEHAWGKLPKLYACMPDRVGRRLFESTLEGDNSVRWLLKVPSSRATQARFPGLPVYHLLWDYLKKHGQELQSLPDRKVPGASQPQPMKTIIEACLRAIAERRRQIASTHDNAGNISILRESEFRNLDDLIRPDELDCGRDIAVNFSKKPSFFRRMLSSFIKPWAWKPSFSRSDYQIRNGEATVRRGGVIEAGALANDRDREILRHKIDFVVAQHKRDCGKPPRDLTTIYDICIQGSPPQYIQLILHGGGAVILDTNPEGIVRPPPGSAIYEVERALANRLAPESLQLAFCRMPGSRGTSEGPDLLHLKLARVEDKSSGRVFLEQKEQSFSGSGENGSRQWVSQLGNARALMGDYLREYLQKNRPVHGPDLPAAVQAAMTTFFEMSPQERQETVRRLRLQRMFAVDREHLYPRLPWQE